MREHLKNLTNYLIDKYRFDEVDLSGDKLIDFIAKELQLGDVRLMKPEKLGAIMCSFDPEDIFGAGSHVLKVIEAQPDWGQRLRGMVALGLATLIRERVETNGYKSITPYQRVVQPKPRTSSQDAESNRE